MVFNCKFKLLVLIAIIFCTNTWAENPEIHHIQVRSEGMLTAIRNDSWNDIPGYMLIIAEQSQGLNCQRFGLSGDFDNGALKVKKILSNLNESEEAVKYNCMRFGIHQNDEQNVINAKIILFFKGVYGRRKPAKIVSIRISVDDPNLAKVSYRHGDLDGFKMRRIEGEWYYSLE